MLHSLDECARMGANACSEGEGAFGSVGVVPAAFCGSHPPRSYSHLPLALAYAAARYRRHPPGVRNLPVEMWMPTLHW